MSRTTIIAVTALAGGLAIYYIATGRRRRREHRERRERSLLKLCQSLPKAELHAHLHGSLALHNRELAPAGVDTSALTVASGDDRSLDACFGIFAAIHKTVTNHKAVERVCREVLEDFAADNVQYLELRTTPRALDDADAEGYIRVVIRELEEFQFKPGNTMRVRLLLSIDRTGSLEKALETVQLAAKFRQACRRRRLLGATRQKAALRSLCRRLPLRVSLASRWSCIVERWITQRTPQAYSASDRSGLATPCSFRSRTLRYDSRRYRLSCARRAM